MEYNPNGMRAFFIELLKEVDENTVIMRDHGVDLTARILIDGLESGTDKSRNFCVEAMCIARDIMIGKALIDKEDKELGRN